MTPPMIRAIGSMFSGTGALDMATMQVFPGAEVAWHCEYDDAPAKILAHHWPTIPNYRDVTQIDWATMPPVDILTAGYPCQPFSQAGQHKGTDDDRHLWPYVREAIRHLRPRYTLLENVAGHRTLGFDRVLGDMAEDGLHVRWASLRASDIGAPHHRERVFILATPADTNSVGLEAGEQSGGQRQKVAQHHRDRHPLPDAERVGWERGQTAESSSTGGGNASGESDRPSTIVTDPKDDGRERARDARHRAAGSSDGHSRDVQWGQYGPAVERWERLTRPAPAPTEPNKNGRPRLNAEFASWMMGLPAGWVTDPAIGISRAEQINAIGNGVVPQQAAAAYGWLLEQALT